MLFHSIKQYLISVNQLLPIVFPNASVSGYLKPGFHMIATIAVKKKKSFAIAAIIAIMWKPLSRNDSDNDR